MENEQYIFYGEPSPFTNLPARHQTTRKLNGAPMAQAYVQASTNSDWFRYLPQDAIDLLSQEEHNICLERFFSVFSSFYQVIPHLFLRDFTAAISQAATHQIPHLQHYSVVLHNAIMSIALGFSGHAHLRSRAVRDNFAGLAKVFVDEEYRHPTLSTIQGLTLLSIYYCGVSELNLGFMHFGKSSPPLVGFTVDTYSGVA